MHGPSYKELCTNLPLERGTPPLIRKLYMILAAQSYHIHVARNFRGVKLSQMDLQLTFRNLILED